MQPNSHRNNLPTITPNKRKITIQKRHLKPQQSNITNLQSISQLIINNQTLPVSLQVQDQIYKDVSVSIGVNSVSVRWSSQVVNLPWKSKNSTWVRIRFGTVMGKVEVRSKQNQNFIGQTCVYTTLDAWKKHQHTEITALTQLSLEQVLTTLKSKIVGKQRINQGKYDITNHIKKRSTERTRSFGLKPKMSTMRSKPVNQLYNVDEKGGSMRRISKKHGAIRFSSNVGFEQVSIDRKHDKTFESNRDKNEKNDRGSTASNSYESDLQEPKFGKRPLRLRQLMEGKIKQNPTFFEDLCDFHTKTVPLRPKFYEQIPYTPEEIEFKRHKFESQFISKKQISAIEAPTRCLQTEQSQVLEDICKSENSQLGLSDTLERGMGQVNHNEMFNIDIDQSGTLCESVFQ